MNNDERREERREEREGEETRFYFLVTTRHEFRILTSRRFGATNRRRGTKTSMSNWVEPKQTPPSGRHEQKLNTFENNTHT